MYITCFCSISLYDNVVFVRARNNFCCHFETEVGVVWLNISRQHVPADALQLNNTWVSFSTGMSPLMLVNRYSIYTQCAMNRLHTLTVWTDSVYEFKVMSLAPSSVLFLYHLRVWLTIIGSDWKQASPELDFTFRKHPYNKAKVMSIMEKKVLTLRVYQSSCPWQRVVVTHLRLFQCKVFILKLRSKRTYPLADNAICLLVNPVHIPCALVDF